MRTPEKIESLDALLTSHKEDPYPVYRELLAKGSVLTDADGKVVVTTYRDCRAALLSADLSTDPRASSWYQEGQSAGEMSAEEQDRYEDPPFIELDPPEHTRLRHLVSQAFAHRAAKAGPAIQAVADECLDRLRDGNSFDAVRDFAYEIPVNVLCDLLDIPKQDQRRLQEWSTFISSSMDPSRGIDPADVDRVTNEFRTYLDALIAEHQKEPRDSLVNGLLSAEEGGDALTPSEISGSILLLLIAGHETTTALISSGVYTLVTEGHLAERLHAEPHRMPAFVDEMLRLAPLVQILYRFARADVTLPSGGEIHKGDTIVLLLSAANRDPSQFENPEEIDLDRSGADHLSFGAGIHYCLGATLGRLQGRIALETFNRRVTNPRLVAGDVKGGPLALGSIAELPITFDAITG